MNEYGINEEIGNMLFCDYYDEWVDMYKVGAVSDRTMDKYKMTSRQLHNLVPHLKCKDITRQTYQKLLNAYAEDHEKVTVIDFHHHCKAAILDIVDEGGIKRDPTRKVIIKGKPPKEKKPKFLDQYQLHALLGDLNLDPNFASMDWAILIAAKTGLRFAEIIGLTPEDISVEKTTLSVNKTWDYKYGTGFAPTKNQSSIRTIPIDFKLAMQLHPFIEGVDKDAPIFIKKRKSAGIKGMNVIYNSTANDVLERHCKKLGIPVISMHGLRHTHASLLLYQGVSIASVSKRLGHSNMNTTQKVYLHIMRELESKDTDLVMRAMATL